MRLRLGIDLVCVEDVEAALRDHDERYLSRVFTPDEVRDCTSEHGADPQRLAARFAAKEATMKALRAGDRAVPWKAIEVRRAADGAPAIHLTGAAAALAGDAGVDEWAVSLTHERGYASAVVIAETTSRT